MIEGPGPNLIGNAQEPQSLDWRARALGFGIVFGVVGLSTQTPQNAEYQFGTHAVQIYESQFKGAIFPPVPGHVPTSAVRTVYGSPQAYDFTLQAVITPPLISESEAIGAEYHFGTHQVQLANSQIQPQLFPAVRTPPATGGQVPLRSFHTNPQEMSRDLTLQGSFPSTPVASGWVLTYISASPQQADLTLQALFLKARIETILAPWNPTTIVGKWQQDPSQLAAITYAPPTHQPPFINPPTLIGGPPDQLQAAAQGISSPVFPARITPPKPGPYVQPVFAVQGQQFYRDIAYIPFPQPVIGTLPPPVILPVVPEPVRIYWDYVPWKADTNRFRVDSANTVWSADGGQTQGTGSSPDPVSNNPNSPKPKPRNPLSVTVTLNTRY